MISYSVIVLYLTYMYIYVCLKNTSILRVMGDEVRNST